MPVETYLLDGMPVPITECPKCGARPFQPFLRGTVQRGRYRLRFGWPVWVRQDYCALICASCKMVAGHESP
jgi:hypothetical protein